MMDYNEDNSDQDAHTSTESVEESEIKNNGSSHNLDPLTEAFNSFHNFQEALKEELQKFQELGKEPISLLHDGAESSSCIHGIQEEKTLAEIKQAHKTLSKLGEAESKAENLKNQAQDLQNRYVEITEVRSFKKRIVKTTSCLLLQLGLLLMVFSFQLIPESENVVPT